MGSEKASWEKSHLIWDTKQDLARWRMRLGLERVQWCDKWGQTVSSSLQMTRGIPGPGGCWGEWGRRWGPRGNRITVGQLRIFLPCWGHCYSAWREVFGSFVLFSFGEARWSELYFIKIPVAAIDLWQTREARNEVKDGKEWHSLQRVQWCREQGLDSQGVSEKW